MTGPRNIPGELRALDQWIVWKLETNEAGKPQKVPKTLDGGSFSTKSDTPFAFNRADMVADDDPGAGGLGFVLTGGVKLADGGTLVALDMDACRDPESGELAPWAREVLELFPPTFTEVTPSGFGIRPWLAVNEPEEWLGQSPIDVRQPAAPNVPATKLPEIQPFGIAPGGAYVTVTGDKLPDAPETIARVDNLGALIDKFKVPKTKARSGKAALPKGEPCTADDIRTRLRSECSDNDLAAIHDADWQRILPKNGKDLSASAAYMRVATHVLRAAGCNGEAARDYLLHETAWGAGDVEGSKDPAKYSRRNWVEDDVARIVAVKGRPFFEPASVFDVIEVRPQLPRDIFAEWRARGPLVHEPTGIEWIDERTGGGLPYGTRCYIIGAPDAGKTVMLVEIADNYLRRGIPCGFLAVDEEAGDVLLRFAQRRGCTREQVENLEGIADVEQQIGALPLRLYGPDWTIEAAAADLAKHGRGALLIDSLQTCRSSAEAGAASLREAVTARTKAITKAAGEHGHVMVATSEMGRAHYANRKAADELDPMAAGKESGAIEYAARILLALRSAGDDVVEVETPKNKLGPRAGKTFLRLDKARQKLAPAVGFVAPDRDARRAELHGRQVRADAAKVVSILLETPGSNKRALHAAGAKAGVSKDRVNDALEHLGNAVEKEPGPKNSEFHRVRVERVPDDVVELLPAECAEAFGRTLPHAVEQ